MLRTLARIFKRKKRYPFFKQYDRTDCGPSCLRMLAKFYGKTYSTEYLRDLSGITSEGVSVLGITDAAEQIGFKTFVATVDYDTLEQKAPLPCIAHWRERHFVVVYEVKKDKVLIADPEYGLITFEKERFVEAWQNTRYLSRNDRGLLIFLEPGKNFDEHYDKINVKKGFGTLIPYIKPYRKYIVQLIIGLLVGSIVQLILPFLTQSIVDKGINYNDLDFIRIILIAQLTLFLSQSFVGVIRSWLLLHVGARINISLASDFLIKLMKLPVAFFDSKVAGDVLQRVQDSQRLEMFLSTSPNTIFSLFNMLIFLIVLFYYNTTIFLIFVGGAVLYLAWILFFMKKREELDHRRFDESSGNSSSLIQIVNGIQEIKICGSEKRRQWGWEEMRIRLYKISVSLLGLTQLQSIGGNTINEVKNIFISFVAANAVINGQMTLGMMLAVQYIIGQLNAPLIQLVQFFKDAQDARISLDRMHEIDNVENEYSEERLHTLSDNEDISIQNLSFRYGGRKTNLVLENVEFKVPKGRVTAIVGESGSGKTTLLKLLLKLYLPTEGNIRIGRADLQNVDTRHWRKSCGVVMQDGYIFTDTIARNITESDSARKLDRERLLNAVTMANIEDVIERLPSGYNTRVGPRGTSGVNLSGGQIQRMLIARAIYKNPNYLFFDEATSALDARNERIVMDNLNRIFEGKTVIVIAHRLSTVKNADQIVVLEKGRVVEIGNHTELVNNRGVYYNLVKNQLELSN